MDYNFNNPFTFPWNSSSGPFMANQMNATQSPPDFPAPVVNTQMSSQQHPVVQGVVTGFNNDVMRFPGQRLSAPTGAGYPFGINSQFNGNQSAGANFNTNWNYASYVNRLPHFNSPVVTPLPVTTSVNGLQSPQSIVVPTVNVGGVNATSNETSSATSDLKTNNDQMSDKAQDDITSEIALKVSSLLSNPTILQNAISQIQNTTGEKNVDEKKPDVDGQAVETSKSMSQDVCSSNVASIVSNEAGADIVDNGHATEICPVTDSYNADIPSVRYKI